MIRKQKDLSSYNLTVRSLEILEDVKSPALESIKTESATANQTAQIVTQGFASLLSEFISDSILSTVEKKEIKRAWNSIYAEYPIVRQRALTAGYPTTNTQVLAYKEAYDALNTGLNGASGVLVDMTTSSAIVPADFKALFDNYDSAKEGLISNISAITFAGIITGGVAGIKWDATGTVPTPSSVYPAFSAALTVDTIDVSAGCTFSWSCYGHFTGTGSNQTFTPSISNPGINDPLPTGVICDITYNGVTTRVIQSVTAIKAYAGIPWVADWDGAAVKTTYDSGRPYILAAGVYAGTVEADPDNPGYNRVAQGVFMGKGRVKGITGDFFGLVAIQSGAMTFKLDGTTGAATFGGTLSAPTGNIGGFTIDVAEGLYTGTGASRVQMKPGAGFWAGATARADAPFSVTEAGVGKFASGTIGVFNINTHLYSESKTAYDDNLSGVHIGSDGIGLGAYFKVSAAGFVTATKISAALQSCKITDITAGDTYLIKGDTKPESKSWSNGGSGWKAIKSLQIGATGTVNIHYEGANSSVGGGGIRLLRQGSVIHTAMIDYAYQSPTYLAFDWANEPVTAGDIFTVEVYVATYSSTYAKNFTIKCNEEPGILSYIGTSNDTGILAPVSAQNITQDDSSDATRYILFADGYSGVTPIKADSGLSYNPSSGLMSLGALTTIGDLIVGGNITVNGLTGVGVVSSGTWKGSIVDVAYGGTGLSSLTAGYIPFGKGTSALGSSANLFWDAGNNRLGINTNTPAYALDLVGSGSFSTSVITPKVLQGTQSLYNHFIPGSSYEILTHKNLGVAPTDIFTIFEIRSPDTITTESTLSQHNVVSGWDDWVRDVSFHNYSGSMKAVDVISHFTGTTAGKWQWVSRYTDGSDYSMVDKYVMLLDGSNGKLTITGDNAALALNTSNTSEIINLNNNYNIGFGANGANTAHYFRINNISEVGTIVESYSQSNEATFTNKISKNNGVNIHDIALQDYDNGTYKIIFNSQAEGSSPNLAHWYWRSTDSRPGHEAQNLLAVLHADTGEFELKGNITPFKNATQSLGYPDFRWQDANFYGTVLTDSLTVEYKLNSADYTSGSLGIGWRLDYNASVAGKSYLEVDNLLVRDTLRTHIFQKDVIKATNGQLYVSDSGIVADNYTGDGTINFDIDKSASFSVYDILVAKDWNTTTGTITECKFQITAIGAAANGKQTYSIATVSGSRSYLQKGMTAVRISGGNLLLNASTLYSPFLDVIKDNVVKSRLGRLDGISGCSGYGLYSENVFLTGKITATSGYIGDSTNGWTIGASGITAKGSSIIQTSASANTGIKLDASSLRLYNGSAQTGELAVDGSGWFGLTGAKAISWTTAGVVTIGGWTASASALSTGAFDTADKMYFGTSGLSLSNTFKVTAAGALTAKSGEVGGFTIDSTEGLYAGTTATRVQMKPGAGFWAGATAFEDAPFSVSSDGNLKSSSAMITGSSFFGGSIENDLFATRLAADLANWTAPTAPWAGSSLVTHCSSLDLNASYSATGTFNGKTVKSVIRSWTKRPSGDIDYYISVSHTSGTPTIIFNSQTYSYTGNIDVTGVAVVMTKNVIPFADRTYNLGSSSNRYLTLYAKHIGENTAENDVTAYIGYLKIQTLLDAANVLTNSATIQSFTATASSAQLFSVVCPCVCAIYSNDVDGEARLKMKWAGTYYSYATGGQSSSPVFVHLGVGTYRLEQFGPGTAYICCISAFGKMDNTPLVG